MDKKALELLQNLVAIPTPTGFEYDGMALLANHLKAASVPNLKIDVHGNLRACVNPDAPLRVMIEGPDQREMDKDVFALSKMIEKELA